MAGNELHDPNNWAAYFGNKHAHGASAPTTSIQYPVTQSIWYNQKVIKLDGWSFIGCRFDNCKLIIETPYFSLRNCYIDESNSIEVHGVMINAIQFLNLSASNRNNSAFFAVRNADGTISIGD